MITLKHTFRKALIRLGTLAGPLLALLLVSAQIAQAFCNVPDAFVSKTRLAISEWNVHDKYSYTEQSPACAYAFSWGYTSFTSRGWGTVPGTTVTYKETNGTKLTGAVSYFNSDKTWFNSTVQGQTWPSGQYDRRTVALHEIGHWMYLDHPTVCGNNHPEAVMHPNPVTKHYLADDDKNGLYALGILESW